MVIRKSYLKYPYRLGYIYVQNILGSDEYAGGQFSQYAQSVINCLNTYLYTRYAVYLMYEFM